MDDARLRAVIREEIALAVKTLGEQAYSSDPGSEGYSLDQAASSFGAYAYRGACDDADEQRAQDAANPFAEPEGEAVTVEVKALVRAEMLDTLRELSTTFSMSGLDDDLRISDRLDHVVRSRESAGE
jgi:hypothetical protein